ncbi:suppressor of fused domain protein [Chitinophagaceae bacterium 26-R-25]|nr:suppressor of fused domain protein [Chitinophagaceae bacterium 26-R-25]
MIDKKVTTENKELAKYITTILGLNRTIQRHWDQDRSNFLDVFNCQDPIDSRIAFCGTIGLSDFPNEIEQKSGAIKNIPIELLITGYKEYDKASNIISTCGFYISKNKWSCQPGSVFMRMVEMYYEKLEMKHILFTSPFLWEGKLHPLKLESKTVNWLLAIPISDSELNYRNQLGAPALEDLFEKKGVDIFDLNRKSVI